MSYLTKKVNRRHKMEIFSTTNENVDINKKMHYNYYILCIVHNFSN